MQNFEILKKSEIKDSFRDKIIVDSYSIKTDHLKRIFKGEIDLEFDWNIGLIVGNSGTGKSTISNQLFSANLKMKEYDNTKSIINNFPEHSDTKKITEILSKMGLNSPPLWLQTFCTLSNGEKMRALLALNLFLKDFFVFDEFTSVVDRTIAQITSYVVQKFVRNENKKFIAISCHSDIIKWLDPDWVFDTNKMIFEKRRYLRRRPKIKISIYRSKEFWGVFKRYHYLAENIVKASDQYVGIIKNQLALFCSVMIYPTKYKIGAPKIYRVSRLVCIPDYQGIGAGLKFMEEIGKIYLDRGNRFTIASANISIIKQLLKSSKWRIIAKGHRAPHASKKKYMPIRRTSSTARYLYSFEMINI